ncbi:cation:proton antiporter [Desertivirga xinjiangensis]|uniref:cation:proton antiporter n=1 Tax=Desertivirga xinjiangensis TaxID=539206 RepID=UPI00210B9785|nr:cation:proton antiporter [Pedobacter xinjiangensis]
MILLSDLDLSLPLKNPVVIFSLVLFIILFAPILFNKIKVPHIIGVILSGVIIGPYGLNLLARDSSIVLFGTVGLLYIMFMAGLEIDIEEFKKTRVKSFVFGLFTFLIPILLGSFAAYYVLGFSIPSAILLGSMLSSHTLLAYPIVSKYGISRIRAVTMSIGGTIITDILSLLVLAIVTGMTKGDIGPAFWIQLVIGCIVFGFVIFYIFPLIARWFFKRFDDNISQYIFVLAIVFLGAFLAEVAGLEAIIGAFLSGLALNRFIPHLSPLMNRIDFVGNAFFIPFFLISVGMLVDVSVLFKGWGAITVAAVMISLAIISKFMAAWFTQKSFKLSVNERQLIFGLSNARVGATLAVVLVGYNIILAETPTGDPIRLLSEDVLNGAILMILITCTISSFVVEKASQKIALKEESESIKNNDNDEKILISLAYPDTVSELVDFGLMLKPKKSQIPVYGLHIVSDGIDDGKMHATGKKMMDKALKHASATENTIIPLTRFDVNIANGIIYTIKEQRITDVLIGLHKNAGLEDFFGPVAQTILKRTLETIFIYKSVQPFNTLKRMMVVVPPQAEHEPGFLHWLTKLTTISKESGLPIIFYAHEETIEELESQLDGRLKASFFPFNEWEDFLIFTRELKPNDLFLIVTSRKDHRSFSPQLDRLPYYLINYFNSNSFILLYPKQLDLTLDMGPSPSMDTSLMDSLSEKINVVNKAGSFFKRLLNK